MNPLAFVLTVLLAWILVSWVCGIAIGCMIELMEDEDEFEFEDPFWGLTA